MEAIADLLPFAVIVGIWLFRAVRGAASKQRPPVQPSADDAPPSAPTPFEQLMRQLEEALEEPKAATELQTAPAGPAMLEPRPTEEPPTSSRPAALDAPTAFEAVFEHEAHGFGADNPISEEAFEARPAFAPRRRPVETDYDPHGLRSGREAAKPSRKPAAKPAPRRGASAWAQRLHDPAAAREALVLKTIFDGPWTPRTGKPDR